MAKGKLEFLFFSDQVLVSKRREERIKEAKKARQKKDDDEEEEGSGSENPETSPQLSRVSEERWEGDVSAESSLDFSTPGLEEALQRSEPEEDSDEEEEEAAEADAGSGAAKDQVPTENNQTKGY